MRPKTSHRRTVLKLLGTIVAGNVASTASVAARPDAATDSRPADPTDPCLDVPPRNPGASVEALTRDPDTYLAVVDRIVGGRFVVLLLEEDEEVVEQLVVPYADLPVEEHDVLLVTLDGETVTDARKLVGETNRRRKRAANRLECLTQ